MPYKKLNDTMSPTTEFRCWPLLLTLSCIRPIRWRRKIQQYWSFKTIQGHQYER